MRSGKILFLPGPWPKELKHSVLATDTPTPRPPQDRLIPTPVPSGTPCSCPRQPPCLSHACSYEPPSVWPCLVWGRTEGQWQSGATPNGECQWGRQCFFVTSLVLTRVGGLTATSYFPGWYLRLQMTFLWKWMSSAPPPVWHMPAGAWHMVGDRNLHFGSP